MSPLTKFWNTATSSQKLALGAFIVAGLIVLVVLLTVATKPDYAPLFSGLNPDDAAKIADKLRENKTPYRLGAGGSLIEVPSDSVYEVRLQMVQEGLPRGGNVGFELFDGNRVGLTQFTEHVNYIRALQGELQRTIAELDTVTSARVHLVLPEEKLYAEEEARPTASVVLNLGGSRGVTKQQVGGIVHLVSSAVESLSPDDVKVLDTSGNLLSSPPEMMGGLTGGGVVMARLQMTREFERQAEQKVQTMLDQVAGAGKAIVRINASIDFDSKETEEAIYEPAADGKGVLQSQDELRETYRGNTVPAAASGVPGVASNTTPRLPAPSDTASDGYERVETSNTYQITRKVQKSTVNPGQVKRLSMALFVDESIDSTQVASLEKVASAAAGIDSQRGDNVVVERLPFAEAEAPAADAQGASRARDLYVSVGKDLVAIILLVVFLVFVKSMFKKSSGADEGGGSYEGRESVASISREIANSPRRESATASQPKAAAAPANGKSTFDDVDSEKMAQAIRGLLTETEES